MSFLHASTSQRGRIWPRMDLNASTSNHVCSSLRVHNTSSMYLAQAAVAHESVPLMGIMLRR
jgi:hypothetical protein